MYPETATDTAIAGCVSTNCVTEGIKILHHDGFYIPGIASPMPISASECTACVRRRRHPWSIVM